MRVRCPSCGSSDLYWDGTRWVCPHHDDQPLEAKRQAADDARCPVCHNKAAAWNPRTFDETGSRIGWCFDCQAILLHKGGDGMGQPPAESRGVPGDGSSTLPASTDIMEACPYCDEEGCGYCDGLGVIPHHCDA